MCWFALRQWQARAAVQDRSAESCARGYKATVTISEYPCLHVEVCGPSMLNLAGESTS